MMRRFLLIHLLTICFLNSAPAQEKHFSASLTPGLMYYLGDLKDSPWPEKGFNHFSLALDIGYRFNKALRLDLGYMRGKISGADSLVPDHAVRNLHFVSKIDDLRLLAYINLNGLRRLIWPGKLMRKQDWSRKFTGPDLILGIGYVHFNPRAFAYNTWYDLQPLGTEGQYTNGEGYPEPYKLWQFSFKYGLGIGYQIRRQVHVELQGIYTQVFTDYLDDVAGTYPDDKELLKSDNGELAYYFAYGGRNGGTIDKGTSRGNPGKRDGYVQIGLKITYIISKDEMRRLMHL